MKNVSQFATLSDYIDCLQQQRVIALSVHFQTHLSVVVFVNKLNLSKKTSALMNILVVWKVNTIVCIPYYRVTLVSLPSKYGRSH